MHDSGFVRVMQSLGDLCTQLDRFAYRERMGLNPFVETDSVDEVAGDVDEAVLTPDFVNRDDVRMPNLRGSSRFAHELFGVNFGRVCIPRNLDRDSPIQFRVARLPNFAEGTLPQAVEQLEMPEHTSGIEIPGCVHILRQIETTAARRARHIPRRIVVDHFNRQMTVRTANLHDGRQPKSSLTVKQSSDVSSHAHRVAIPRSVHFALIILAVRGRVTGQRKPP